MTTGQPDDSHGRGWGRALIADKLLLSNTGSAVESGCRTVPRQCRPPWWLNLGNSERGLYLLAHAANAFDAEAKARQLVHRDRVAAPPRPRRPRARTSSPKPDAENPAEFEMDAARSAEAADSVRRGVHLQPPPRADAAVRAREKERRKRMGKETPSEKAGRLRDELTESLELALNDARHLGRPRGGQRRRRSPLRLRSTSGGRSNRSFRALHKFWLRHEPDLDEDDEDDDEAGE